MMRGAPEKKNKENVLSIPSYVMHNISDGTLENL